MNEISVIYYELKIGMKLTLSMISKCPNILWKKLSAKDAQHLRITRWKQKNICLVWTLLEVKNWQDV